MSGTKTDAVWALLRTGARTVGELVQASGATKRHVLATLRAGVDEDEIERIELVRGGPLYRATPADPPLKSVWLECSWCKRAIDLSQEIELSELCRFSSALGEHLVNEYRLVGWCERCLSDDTGE